METLKAKVEEDGGSYVIRIGAADDIVIPMTEDNANEVKSAFNKLVTRIRSGMFQIELEGAGDDLFSQVATEYIMQLNKEMKAVGREMKEQGLV